MTSFYNKYYLNNNNSSSTSTNVLKKDYTLDSTDYEKLKINEQYNKLYLNIYNENKNMIIENENKKIYNLSLAILIKNASTVYINVLNDLSIYFNKENDKYTITALCNFNSIYYLYIYLFFH